MVGVRASRCLVKVDVRGGAGGLSGRRARARAQQEPET